jgi:flagellar assembly protein FliH
MAGIIKAGQAELLIESGSSRAFEFGDISRLAEEEIAKAKKQGAAIVAQAEQRAVKIESDAALAGQQRAANEAIAVAEKRVKKALQPLLQAMADGVQQLDQQRLQWQQEWETQLIDLACAIAEKIIRHELSFRPEVSTSWVKEVLEMASSETSAQLLFHPEDHQALGAQAERIRQAVSRGLTLDIQPDDTLSRGECRLVTRQGELDQRIESQLSRVMEELLGVPRASRELTGNPSSTGEQTPVPPPAPQTNRGGPTDE